MSKNRHLLCAAQDNTAQSWHTQWAPSRESIFSLALHKAGVLSAEEVGKKCCTTSWHPLGSSGADIKVGKQLSWCPVGTH